MSCSSDYVLVVEAWLCKSGTDSSSIAHLAVLNSVWYQEWCLTMKSSWPRSRLGMWIWILLWHCSIKEQLSTPTLYFWRRESPFCLEATFCYLGQYDFSCSQDLHSFNGNNSVVERSVYQSMGALIYRVVNPTGERDEGSEVDSLEGTTEEAATDQNSWVRFDMLLLSDFGQIGTPGGQKYPRFGHPF